jgi:hypothetical protein
VPAAMGESGVAATADRLGEAAGDRALLDRLATVTSSSPDDVALVLHEVAERFHEVAVVAAREADRRRELAAIAPVIADVPTLPDDIHDLAGLLTIGSYLH